MDSEIVISEASYISITLVVNGTQAFTGIYMTMTVNRDWRETLLGETIH